MILVRTVFQAQFGKAGELVAAMKQSSEQIASELGVERRWRLLTDISGSFDTVVQELEAESLAEWDQVRMRLFQTPAFREWFASVQAIVVSGRSELFTIEAER